MKSRIIIYHGPHCSDGFTGAWIAHNALRESEEDVMVVYYPTHYGEEKIPDVVGYDEVILIDFCYPVDVLHNMCMEAGQVFLLDHHKTTEEALEEYREAGVSLPDNLTAHIKFDVSGAVIAWQFFTNTLGVVKGWDSDMPTLIKYVSDRDLYNWALPYSREISAYIMTAKKTFERWDALSAELENDFQGVVEKGKIILETRMSIVNEIVSNTACYAWIGKYPVWTCNSPTLYSDAADALIAEKAFIDRVAVCYSFTSNHVKFSVRSAEGCYVTAKELAEYFGGGGHVHAAGFELSHEEFFDLVTFMPGKNII